MNRRAVAIVTDKIRRETDGTFTVPSETKKDVEYSVDIEIQELKSQRIMKKE